MLKTEETDSGGSILRNNDKRDHGWYRSENVLAHKWTRIVGPQAIAIYHLFKSMCRGCEEATYPEVRQQDWAALLGIGLQPFQRSLKRLVDAGLIDRILPQGEDRLLHKPTIYIVNAAEDIPITPELLRKFEIKAEKFPSNCRFNDPLFAMDQWNINMFQTTAKAPRTKRRIRDRLNDRSTTNTSQHIKFNMSEDFADNICLLNRQYNTKIEEHLSKDKCNGSNEPCNSQNNHSSWDEYNMPIEEIKENGFVLVSIPQKDQLPHTAKAEQELDRTEVKTPPRTSMTDRIKKNTSPRSKDASRQMKMEQLPPLDQMPQSLQVWYTLKGLVTMPTAITYFRCVKKLQDLERGKFPTDYQNLDAKWTHRNNCIPIEKGHLTKQWTDQEIAHLLDTKFRQILTDAAYTSQKTLVWLRKLTFESFIFHPHSGTSQLQELAHRPLQLLRSVNMKQTIEHDPYPQCTHEIAEVLEISRKTNPEEYAGIARNFSKIVKFFQPLPVEEGHERDGVLKFVNQPQRIANSLVGFFEEQYSWVVSKGAHAGLLSLKAKPIRKWLEWGEWGDQEISIPGREKRRIIWDLLDEYNQYGKIRMTVPESTNAREEYTPEEEQAPPKPTEAELRQREEEAAKYLAPDDIIRVDGEKLVKGTMLLKLKEAMARMKRGIPDPIVDESYAGF